MAADKEEIRDRNDIVDVIGTYVALKRRGRNWLGLCPFHQEKTPSFNVSQETQTFRCFGCGASGDVFKFVERFENMSFVEAAEFLARRVGLTFQRQGGTQERTEASERDRLFEINAAALAWFRKMLDKVAVAKDYVRGRGLAHETVQRFQIGYAPDSWDGLTGYLRAQRHDLKLAETAGLVRKGQDGSYYDNFRNRILFPIHDEQERIVGFGGRAFGDEQPKYLNTGETPIFVKSKLLYGLPFARRKIAAEGKVLLMEGYTDVIAAHQAGFTNAVATLGTSLTEDHARKLARLMPTDPVVILVYDADNAGIKATLRASELLEKEGVQVRVARLPAGDDPDSLLKRGEIAAFQAAIDNASGRVEYQLERIVAGADQSTDAGRAKMLLQIVAILATVPTHAERDLYVEKVWRYHPMSAHSPDTAKQQLHRDVEEYAARKKGGRPIGQTPMPSPPQGRDWGGRYGSDRGKEGRFGEEGYRRGERRFDRSQERRPPMEPPPLNAGGPTAEERAERELIRALADSEWRRTVLKRVTADDFITPTGHQFYEFVQANEAALQSGEADLIRLLSRHEDPDFSAAILARLQEFPALIEKEAVSRSLEEQLTQMSDALLTQCIDRLRRHHTEQLLQAEIEHLQSKPMLTKEDMERVRECQRLLRALKGSKADF